MACMTWGGMTCFGPILREENEPVFHAEWEKRVFAMGLAGGLWTNFDEARRALEQMVRSIIPRAIPVCHVMRVAGAESSLTCTARLSIPTPSPTGWGNSPSRCTVSVSKLVNSGD